MAVCMGPFEGGLHYCHYLCHSLASGQTTEREDSPTHQQKIEVNIESWTIKKAEGKKIDAFEL